jgi:hypothetical protein
MVAGLGAKSAGDIGGLGVLLLIPTLYTANLYLITLLFALSTFSYAAFRRLRMFCRLIYLSAGLWRR